MLNTELIQRQPNIILVTFSGRVTHEEVSTDRRFGEIIKSLDGEPFRVLCDFTTTRVMDQEVAAVFMKAQAFAVSRGMERDAFACNSSILRLQFERVARESGRAKNLGELRFFDTLKEAREFIMQ